MQFIKRAWVEIDLSKIESNYKNIKRLSADRKVFAVVKADAYGHGAEMFVKSLEALGADGYCVSNVNEALIVKNFAKNKPILILGYTPKDNLKLLIDNNISQTIISYEYAKEISEELKETNASLSCHIKIDTGMGRLGLDCTGEQSRKICLEEIEKISNLSGILLDGIFTHYSSADSLNDEDIKFTENQFEAFDFIVKNCNIDFKYVHCCNSAGVSVQESNRGNVVRPGIILYGLLPSNDIKVNIDLTPVLSLKTVVAMIKTVKKGAALSYGRTFIAERHKKVATIPIGYADGYPRFLSNKGKVLINGEFCNILGRVCMDQLLVDVSHIEKIKVGDTVTLIGKDGENSITADDIAKIGGTVNYEIVCGISQRIPRVYIRNGKTIKYMNYMLSEDKNDF